MFFMKYWAGLILVFAIGLLVFELRRIERKPSLVAKSGPREMKSEPKELKKPSPQKKSWSTLNRLDPVTKIVHGVKERCLKLLPRDELENLDLPVNEQSSNPVKKVVYLSGIDLPYAKGNSTLSRQPGEGTRFNLFTGNQTFDQREESFKVKETAEIHYGFYSEHGGFKISDEDKIYMQNCKVVVSTCAFGGGDDLYQPIGMSEASLRKVCYVAFWDEVTCSAQESEGYKIGDDGFIGKWRIMVVKDLPFTDQRLNGKIPKEDVYSGKDRQLSLLGVYTVSAPFHPFGGAIDVIVVEQPDGSFKSSPWYIQFGKFQGVLNTKERVVSINVNGVDANFNMYLDHKGEAYFQEEADVEEGESASYPSSSDDADGQCNSSRS